MLNPALVLTTVNASHRRELDADELARYLLDLDAAKGVPGHMSVFFGEISPSVQIAFAVSQGISRVQLVAAAKAFAAYSGETYPLAA